MAVTEIFYFTGTGNSLVVARDIAEITGGRLISIPSVLGDERITTGAEVIGIVFPVYFATNDCGVPRIIRRFLNQIQHNNSKYLFAVCTHGGNPGTTIENIEGILRSRGWKLDAGFTVKMNNKDIMPEKQEMLAASRKKKTGYIGNYVTARKRGTFETRGIIGKLFWALFLPVIVRPVFSSRYRKLSRESYRSFQKLVPLADRSFRSNERCNGCGICAKICPVNNIEMVDNRPSWRHHCENCLACYQWCPREAIFGKIIEHNPRYHHPDVKLADMMWRN